MSEISLSLLSLGLDCLNVQFTTVGMLCFPYQEENVLVFTEQSDEIDKFPSNCGMEFSLLPS